MPRVRANTIKDAEKSVAATVKAAQGQPQKEWRIEGLPGLVLVTRPSGTAGFYLYYTNRYGKAQKLKLGEVGALTFADAKKKTRALLVEIENGADPAGDRSDKRGAMTFEEMARRFIAEGDLTDKTRAVYEACLRKDAYPAIGHMPADDVTEDDVMSICRKIMARPAKLQAAAKKAGTTPRNTDNRVQAERTKTTIGGAYRWAKKLRLVKHNPARDIGRLAPKVARGRTPTDAELKALWAGLDEEGRGASEKVRLIIKLALLTGQRRDEVCGAEVSEFEGLDSDNPIWRIPGDQSTKGKVVRGRMKNGREQVVPLSPLAAELWRQAFEGADGKYVFPAELKTVKPGSEPRAPHIHGESVTMAMRRLRERVEIEDLTVHDFRRAIGNWLEDHEFSREVIDRVLAHVDQSVTGKHYANSARRLGEVRVALEAWASHVENVVSGGMDAMPLLELD